MNVRMGRILGVVIQEQLVAQQKMIALKNLHVKVAKFPVRMRQILGVAIVAILAVHQQDNAV